MQEDLHDLFICNPSVLIGYRIYKRRTELHLSSDVLADFLGISHLQFDKYENGEEDIFFDLLCCLCRLLQTDINYFYADFPKGDFH